MKVVQLSEVDPEKGFMPGEIVVDNILRMRGCGCCEQYGQCTKCDFISQSAQGACQNCGYTAWKTSSFEAWDTQRKSDWRSQQEKE